jgi:hypothetical protein
MGRIISHRLRSSGSGWDGSVTEKPKSPKTKKPKGEEKPSGGKKSFRAKILEARGGGGAWVEIPFDVLDVYGTRRRVPVKATFDGKPYRGSLVPMGGGKHVLGILKEIRTEIGKGVGDTVAVVIEPDAEPRVVKVPDDLAKALSKNKTAKTAFDKLSYSHQREYVNHIEEAKKEETRQKRIEKTLEMLVEKAK